MDDSSKRKVVQAFLEKAGKARQFPQIAYVTMERRHIIEMFGDEGFLEVTKDAPHILEVQERRRSAVIRANAAVQEMVAGGMSVMKARQHVRVSDVQVTVDCVAAVAYLTRTEPDYIKSVHLDRTAYSWGLDLV